ncbi:MAG: tetratricopeptide repeat protein [Myxococcaceae bacterium]
MRVLRQICLVGACFAGRTTFAAEEKRDVSPNQHVVRSSFEGLGRSPEEQAQLDELAKTISVYEAETTDFRRSVQQLIERRYGEKRGNLAQSYESALRDFETLERKERLDAIAQFEEFLERYPDERRYTPDVLFRLAELYYERSADDHLVAMRTYEEQVRKATDANAELPPEPQPDFARSIVIYRRLLSQYPQYKFNDAAMYLLGYCLEKQNSFDEGRASYEQLIAKFPKSKFATEAWVRIGEWYFDQDTNLQALPLAAQAYEAAVQDVKHPLYDKALYKLGWTYYRMDRFDDAVARFLELVDTYDKRARKSGRKEVEGDLRNEALQYAAISFADEKWGSLEKAKALIKTRGGGRYEAELYRRLGDVLFDQTRHEEAIAAYQLFLQKEPTAREAPQVQQKIVEAFERDRRMAEAFREAAMMGALFGPGSAWYKENQKDSVLVSDTQTLVERSLYSSAIYHHQEALKLKQTSKTDEARVAFEIAAKGYASYLERFPRAKQAYDIEFYLAECLYNSNQFVAAAMQYEKTRDSTAAQTFAKDAAFAAVLSWEKALELEIRTGAIPNLKPLRSSERKEKQPTDPIPLAETERRFALASDAFVRKQPKDERAPGIAYKVAELYYAHQEFPEARQRFEAIIQQWPKTEVAQFATNLTVETFLITKDWRSVEEVSSRLAANEAVIKPGSPLHQDLTKFKLAGRFKLADQLFAEGQFEGAASKYIELVAEAPQHEFADKALNNAAVAYEQTRRFDTALKTYERIFKEYPKSRLADQALFRVAVNAENSYDFDKAVRAYQRLVREYPRAKDREAALFNAARLLEGLQRYREAATAFSQYANLFPKAEDAAKNQYRAALLYEKQEDWKAEIGALNGFVKKFGRDPAQQEWIVDAYKRIGDASNKAGAQKEAQNAWGAAATEFAKRKMVPDQHPVAAEAAAHAKFQLAETVFAQFDALKIGGKGKALEKSFAAKRAAVKRVNDSYAEVFPYKRLEWTLAALYRRGSALERFANTIIETPVPSDVKRLGEDAVVAYQDLLAQQTLALEDKAVESYSATLAEAKKNRISNPWTKKTLEALNRFRPKEFPVLKEPKAQLTPRLTYADALTDEMSSNPGAASSAGGRAP